MTSEGKRPRTFADWRNKVWNTKLKQACLSSQMNSKKCFQQKERILCRDACDSVVFTPCTKYALKLPFWHLNCCIRRGKQIFEISSWNQMRTIRLVCNEPAGRLDGEMRNQNGNVFPAFCVSIHKQSHNLYSRIPVPCLKFFTNNKASRELFICKQFAATGITWIYSLFLFLSLPPSLST